jgi:hypothetical protein
VGQPRNVPVGFEGYLMIVRIVNNTYIGKRIPDLARGGEPSPSSSSSFGQSR